jgi:hypothetical protein
LSCEIGGSWAARSKRFFVAHLLSGLLASLNMRTLRSTRLFQAQWPIIGIAVLMAATVFIAGIIIDVVLHVEDRRILYSDVFTSCVAGALAYIAGRYYARARVAAYERLQATAEVNHHVRNALTAVLYSVHARRDPGLMEITQQAVGRIDWVLKEVLGTPDQNPRLEAPKPPARYDRSA